MKNTYIIEMLASTEYIIRAESEEEALDRAYEYFAEYEPVVNVMIDNDTEYEIEI